MKLLLDTHILVWLIVGDRRLTRAQHEALVAPSNDLFASAACAYEYTHLQADGRIPISEDIDFLSRNLGFEVLDLPGQIWRCVAELPMIHRDPIDRLQIAHALTSELILVSSDRHIRQYPVETI